MPTKIFLYIVAVVSVMTIALSASIPAFAEENNGIFAQHKLWLHLNSDLTSSATYEITIINHNSQLVSELTLQMPFKEVSSPKFIIDGQSFDLIPEKLTDSVSFHVEFPGNAILPQQSKTLRFTFETGVISTQQAGIIQLHIGKVDADHIITDFQLHVNYPANFPPLIYTSGLNAGSNNDIFLVGLNGMLVQWGLPVAAEISEQINLEFPFGVDNVLFNLPYDGQYQELTYLNLQNLGLAATDAAYNTWGIAQPTSAASPISYTAYLQTKSTTDVTEADFASINYHEINLKLPPELQSISATSSKTEKLQKLYDAMLHNFAVAGETSRNMSLKELEDWINGGKNNLTNSEFAYVAANYCQQLDLTCNVAYGYLWGEDFNKVETSQPYVWLEAYTDKLTIIDPYLAIVSGYNFFDVPASTRLVMGIWNPAVPEDSVLGLLTNKPRLRPNLMPAKSKPITKNVYLVQPNFPEQIRGGEFFSGKLTVTNDSGKFIALHKFDLNSHDITVQILKVNDHLQRVILPLGETIINIDWLREPNFLADESKNMTIRVVPTSSQFQTIETNFVVKFVPNTGLLGVILIGIIVLLVLLGMLLIQLWLKQLLFNKRLVESKRRRLQKIAELEANN